MTQRDDYIRRYKQLVSLDTLRHHDPERALQELGTLIDLSLDLEKVDGARQATDLAAELGKAPLSTEQRATLHYFVANAWSNIRHLTRFGTPRVWDWEQEEFEHEITNLRLALREPGFVELPAQRRCEIHTNLANALDTVGRVVDALEHWDASLSVTPDFQMTQGNRGIGLWEYAKALHDDGQRAYLAWHAHAGLQRGLSGGAHPSAQQHFSTCLEEIGRAVKTDFLAVEPEMDGFSLGTTSGEAEYRQWCLKNRLFINPVNDLGEHAVAAEDALSLPPIAVALSEGPYYPGFFNQLKQEYASARYLLFAGLQVAEPHFSDKDTHLVNTLDYPAYCLAAEQVKVAFRVAYSLLDKIAFFLNHYLRLGIPDHQVSLKTFWYVNRKRDQGLRQDLASRDNWALRGLFWLGKDLYEDKQGFRDAIEPEAQELKDIRNHLEHKYLKLHSGMWSGPDTAESPSFLTDTLACSLYRSDFEKSTVRLFKMARAALIYMALAIHREEQVRARARGHGKIAPSLPMDRYDDEWKS